MAAAAPLTAAQEAALKAEFGKVFNGARVKAHTADTLVKHFAGQGCHEPPDSSGRVVIR
jgi:hypothetical protein